MYISQKSCEVELFFFFGYDIFLLVVSHSLFHRLTPSFHVHLLNKIPAHNPL